MESLETSECINTLTWIEKQQELYADVIADIEFELLQLDRDVVEVIRQGGNPQQTQTEEIELLAVV